MGNVSVLIIHENHSGADRRSFVLNCRRADGGEELQRAQVFALACGLVRRQSTSSAAAPESLRCEPLELSAVAATERDSGTVAQDDRVVTMKGRL